ncbi:MAG: cell division protein ZipA [Gammaproteobacteria bacterium]|nr:cell division protein ZipA [Gammaproteobacteria bacterium]
MSELRLILLGIGAVVIAGIYLYSRYVRREEEAFDRENGDWSLPDGEDPIGPAAEARQEPAMGDRDAELFDDEELPSIRATGSRADSSDDHATSAASRASNGSPPAGEKIIALSILPSDSSGRFQGNHLLDIFERAGLVYGRFDVFHRMIETDDGPQSVFSVASATEPGSFDITEMADQTFKGLSLFMLLPGPQGGVAAFADMLATARRIAQQLGAEVTDQQRSTLTKQTAHHLREEIIAFEHQARS